ncbi:MAG TPA: phage/plasmid primase, P4 family, partial [Tissierellaceae bacterium]|nr:phage/plasmid primase, P4 family [Tissierellaceae bacterium]
MFEFEYIILDDIKKTPVHKLRNGGYTYEEVQYANNLAVFVPEPYVVIDVDNMEQAYLLKKILDDLKIVTMIQQTDRGMHFWFKNDTPLTNVVDAKSAIGIRVDIRSYGKISYVVVKKDGMLRNWISNTSDVPKLPKWLLPVVSQYDFYKMGEGEGRNNGLYAYILVLQELGFKKEEVIETLELINKYILKAPVSQAEFDTITRDEAFKPDDTVKYSKAVVDDKVQHHLLADLLIDEFKIITANGDMYMYVDGYYKKGEVYILQRVLDAFPAVKRNFRTEIIEYIKIQSYYDMTKHKESTYHLNLSNGRLDVLNGKLYQHDPDIVEFVRVPVYFDAEAYDENVDNMLNKLFVNDMEVRLLFEEMIGYSLTRNQKYQRGFMFYGDGSNGKSTMLEMIRQFFGGENVTSVDLGKLSDNYSGAELENKLVNIGDDINTKVLRDTGDIKKLFTGEGMLVRPIYKPPFMLHNFAKMIFSANTLPHSTDKSHGFLRRFEFIPL